MGVRVDADALHSQLKELGREHYMQHEFHQLIAAGKMPLTIGGGIGQSRLCMFMMKKVHIGEVQSSEWPDEVVKVCEEFGVKFL